MHAQGPAPLPSSKTPLVPKHLCASGLLATKVALPASRRSQIRFLRSVVTAARDQHAACQLRAVPRRNHNADHRLLAVTRLCHSPRRCLILSAHHGEAIGGADQVPGQSSSSVESSADDF